MKLKVAIVDDNDILRKNAEDVVRKTIPEGQLELKTYTKGEGLLFDMEENADIYILDVEMPGINGIELAKEIRKKDKSGEIIFLTAYAKYAVYGYESHAYSYILKDEMDSKLSAVLGQIYDEMCENRQKHYIIETSSRFEKIPMKEILYISKEEKNCIFMTREGEYRERTSLGEVYQKLSQEEFIYIDKGQIVNIPNIERIVQETIYMGEDIKLTISRANTKKVKNAVKKYWSGKI